jgi:hypothetical protein
MEVYKKKLKRRKKNEAVENKARLHNPRYYHEKKREEIKSFINTILQIKNHPIIAVQMVREGAQTCGQILSFDQICHQLHAASSYFSRLLWAT